MSKSASITPAAGEYDDNSFWEKTSRYAKWAGREMIEKALWLHYAAQDDRTPLWAKTTIYGALAYFILPADAIPDFIPAAGLTDDFGALVAALTTVAIYVTPEVKEQTTAQLRTWFGESGDGPER